MAEEFRAEVEHHLSALITLTALQEMCLGSMLADRTRAEAGRKRLESRLQRLAQAYIDAGMTESEYQRERQEIQLKLAQLENPRVKTVFETGKFLGTLGPVRERATKKERRDILRMIFEAVHVNIDEGKVTRVVPKPAFEVFFEPVRKVRHLGS